MPVTSPEVRIRSFERGDEGAVLDLYNHVFPGLRTDERWRWECEENPRGPAELGLAFSGERLVGHSVAIPLRLRWHGRDLDAVRTQNVMVHPDFRRRGILPATLDAIAEGVKRRGVEMAVAFPNDRSLPSMVGSCRHRYQHAFDIPTYTAPLAGRILNADRRGAITVEDAAGGFTEVDVAFMARSLARYEIVSVRDRAYLDWRYHRRSGKSYRIVRAFQEGAQKGLAVIKPYWPTKTIDLVELLFDEDALLLAALREIGERGAGEGASAMSTWSMPHYPLHARLVELGFVVERSTHFIIAPLSPQRSIRLGDPAAYYLSMGDSDVP